MSFFPFCPDCYACMLNHFSYVQLLVIFCTIAHQTSLSMGFSRQEYWRGLPFPPPGDLPHPGIKPTSLTSALSGKFFTTNTIWGALSVLFNNQINT